MSHQPERIEKDCLNCGAIVEGRYCQACGQENIVTKQNFWSLAKHFIYDIFHFDGKFFDTLKYLLLNPGRVPREYIAGRRMHYLDPIRMYLFTSAVFFLIFFSVNEINVGAEENWSGRLSKKERMEMAMELHAREKNNQLSSFEKEAISLLLDSTLKISVDDEVDSLKQDSIVYYQGKPFFFKAHKASTIQAVDSALQKNNWLTRQIMRKVTNIDRTDDGDADKTMIEQFLHRLPYLLFVSLPFFALILKLLYYRRKQFFYSDHIIFTLYHYIFSFLLLLLLLGSVRLSDWSNWSVFGWVTFGLGLWWAIYLYKGMRNFYGQSRGKTIGKFLLLNLLGFFAIMLLLLIFILITAIQLS